MRIEINTNGKPVTDVDIRALYLLAYALDKSSPRMMIYNLKYIADRCGFDLVKKKKSAA